MFVTVEMKPNAHVAQVLERFAERASDLDAHAGISEHHMGRALRAA